MGDGGRLIFTGSVLGERRARASPRTARRRPGSSAGEGLALDLAPAGITVNVVAPGLVRLTARRGVEGQPTPRARSLGTPRSSDGAPRDLAGAYQFLASDAAAFITGTVLNVDGGYLLV
jgi:NAD(P)-dependent dehydrogenase (short-subunit alcohol dehydrogenase family)